jgi:aspartyl-tRNA synthetase
MGRVYARDACAGKDVLVQGWVESLRDKGALKFLLLRDKTGTIQVTGKKGVTPEGIMERLAGLSKEDCVSVRGEMKKAPKSDAGLEMFPRELEIVSKSAVPLPLDDNSHKDQRFEYRFMDIRNPKVRNIFLLKDAVFTLIREYFESSGFVEIHTPVIQAAGAEGGSNLFQFKYYDKTAFLRQSPQLYKQMMMSSGLDRVYEIGPAFRAEEFHTRRHVSEFQSVDFELAWIKSEEDVMKVMENLVHHVYRGLKEKHPGLLKELGADVKVPKVPFKRITYEEAVKLLKVKWGEDLGDESERRLGEIMKKKGHEWYWITKFPAELRCFYIMMDGKYSRGFDLDYRGMEMTSGGQREHRHDVLVKIMKSKGLDPADFKFYLDPFKYACPPHGGIGFGVERFIQQILGLADIKEAIMFPRTPERLVP